MRDLWEEAMGRCAQGKHGAAFSPAATCGECIDWALAEARKDALLDVEVAFARPSRLGMELVDGPVCGCGKPSRLEGGECGNDHLQHVHDLIRLLIAEAREEGRREGMEAFTAEAQESVEVARREVLGEAAQLCREVRDEHYSMVWDACEACEERVRALADQPPQDTGWRARPPTPDEIEAHRKVHAPGVWAVRMVVENGDWVMPHEQSHTITQHYPNRYSPWSREDVQVEAEEYDRWRPLTIDLMPAPWPVEENDDEH